MPINELIEKAKTYLPPEKMAVIERAYEFAAKAHEGQTRKSGEPYIEHPLHVAMISGKFAARCQFPGGGSTA